MAVSEIGTLYCIHIVESDLLSHVYSLKCPLETRPFCKGVQTSKTLERSHII